MGLISDLQAEAAGLGFPFIGVSLPQTPVHYSSYELWLEAGRHASMHYLSRPDARLKRKEPRRILPGLRSILITGTLYLLSSPGQGADRGRIAGYALGEDYHTLLLPRLDSLHDLVVRLSGQRSASRAYTDTGPILERDMGMAAGLGWIGKNTCLIHPGYGSNFLLAELFLDVEIEPSPPFTPDRCGSCRRCIEACPTGCILPDRTLDARRCISYLTIENKGSIPLELRPLMGNWIFGCDVCQQVCPWNRFNPKSSDHLEPEISSPLLASEILLTPTGFNQKFRTSPVLRSKRRGYLRNVAVALGNSRDPAGIPALAEVLRQEIEPLVREHAAWALGQISTAEANRVLEKAHNLECDPQVLHEINLALDGIDSLNLYGNK